MIGENRQRPEAPTTNSNASRLVPTGRVASCRWRRPILQRRNANARGKAAPVIAACRAVGLSSGRCADSRRVPDDIRPIRRASIAVGPDRRMGLL